MCMPGINLFRMSCLSVVFFCLPVYGEDAPEIPVEFFFEPTAEDVELRDRNIRLFNAEPEVLEAFRRERDNRLGVEISAQAGDCRKLSYKYLIMRDGTDNVQDIEISEQVFNVINSKAPPLVAFRKKKLVPFDEGGTCSAMALDFAARYLTQCSEFKDSQSCEDCVSLFKPYYQISTSLFASRQAAYNTIKVREEGLLMNSEKVKHAKMQALANYHDLTLTPVTDSIKKQAVFKNESKFINKFNALDEGVYVIRLLHPNYSVKMEWYGHTMILVKEKGFSIFYNNGDGALSVDEVGSFFVDILDRYTMPEFRIYRATRPPEGCKNL